MRDYKHIDRYLTELLQDTYPQPADPGHTAWAMQAVLSLCTAAKGIPTVLDVGCGQGFLAGAFEELGMKWTGVVIGQDYTVCKHLGLNVFNMDMSFLDFEDESFDLVFARHVLEHSPMPILTLMEWRRVSRNYLCLVAPAPHYWGVRGKNHYSIVEKPKLKWWLERSGWEVLKEEDMSTRSYAFLKHNEVYQEALEKGHDKAQEVLDESYPEGPVEYRFLCQKGEMVRE